VHRGAATPVAPHCPDGRLRKRAVCEVLVMGNSQALDCHGLRVQAARSLLCTP